MVNSTCNASINFEIDAHRDRANIGLFAAYEIAEIFELLLSRGLDNDDLFMQLRSTLLDRGRTLNGVILSVLGNENRDTEEMRKAVNWRLFHQKIID